MGVKATGWWEMLRGMCEKSSTYYKKRFLGFQVVKYPFFVAKMYVIAYHFKKKQ